MGIRFATENDAELVAPFAREIFDATFSGHPKNSPADMKVYMDKAFAVETIREELADCNAIWFLYEQNDEVAGYVKLRLGTEEECIVAENPIELCRLYAGTAFQGTGIGRALLLRAFEEAAAIGADIMWLGVWEYNHKAQEFYEKFGFERSGQHTFLLGSDPQIDLIFSRRIG
ncbi:MAG: GNAT family N-acetyltransferase [Pyrinomonadaceae bacterium]